MISAIEWARSEVRPEWSRSECQRRTRDITWQAPWWWAPRGTVPPNPYLKIRSRIRYDHYENVAQVRAAIRATQAER